MSGYEIDYIRAALAEDWAVPMGPDVTAFEQSLAQFTESPEVLAVASGTAALHLALLALEIGPGDEVIVQSFTFCASANPVVYCGATPVFVDSELDSWNMDPTLLENAIKSRMTETGRKPKAIIPVSLYGMPYQADSIIDIANRYAIPIIEDAAEGFGSRYNGKMLGTFGRMGILSFNGNKMITTSGGGAILCQSKQEKEYLMWLATQARECYPYYQHEAIGYNYRLSNISACIGRAQLAIAHEYIAHHKHVQSLYFDLLTGIDGITIHANPAECYDSNFWLCTITIDPLLSVFGQDMAYMEPISHNVGGISCATRHVKSLTTEVQPNDNVEALRIALDRANVETRPLWKPMHLQPIYATCPAYINHNSESLFKSGLCLPAGPYVTDDDISYIVNAIKSSIH